MKKIICVFLSVLMIVSFASCGETVKDKEDQEVVPEGENDQMNEDDPIDENGPIDVTMVTAKKDPVGTILLCESGEGGIVSDGAFHSAREYGISTPSIDHSFSKLEGTQKVFGEEKTVLKYKNSEVCLKNDDSEEFGSFYCITDEYSSDDGKLYVRYLHGSDIVCQYHKSGMRGDEKGSLTNESLEKKAYEFLQTLYSKDLLDNFTCIGVEYDELMNCVFVDYRRYIEGYATDESIMLMLTNKGVPFGMNADNIGKYNYTATVTKEELDTAKELLFEKVASLKLQEISHSKDSVALTTDTSGKVYLETWFTFTVGEEGEKSMESLYVNVN